MANEEIQAKFGADTSPVDRALRALRGEMGKFSKDVTQYFKNALGMFTGAVGFASIVSSLKGIIDEVERLRAQSQATGIGVGLLQDLNNIAIASGLSGDAVSSAISRWMNALPAGTNVEKAFMALADKLAATVDPATRAKMAMDAFGRSGVDMLRIMGEGSAGISAMAKEMSKFSDEEIAAIEALDNRLDKIGNKLKVTLGKVLALGVSGMTHATQKRSASGEIIPGAVVEGEAAVVAAQKRYEEKRSARVAADAKDVDDAKKSTQEMLDAEWTRLTYEERQKALRTNWLDLSTKINKQELSRVERVKTLLELQKVEAQIEKEKTEEIKKQNGLARERQAMGEARSRQWDLRDSLAVARSDFTKWGVQELAEQPNNYATTRMAREALRQLNFAKISSMIGRSDWEEYHMGRYETIVKQNPALRSGDRDPFGSLVKQIQESDNVMQDILTKQGIKVSELVTGE